MLEVWLYFPALIGAVVSATTSAVERIYKTKTLTTGGPIVSVRFIEAVSW